MLYNAAGRVLAVRDPLDHRMTFGYDNANRWVLLRRRPVGILHQPVRPQLRRHGQTEWSS